MALDPRTGYEEGGNASNATEAPKKKSNFGPFLIAAALVIGAIVLLSRTCGAA